MLYIYIYIYDLINYHIYINFWTNICIIIWCSYFDLLDKSFCSVTYNSKRCISCISNLYPEWPHRQGGCLACWSCKIDSPVELRLHRFILCTRRSGGTAYEGGGCDQSIWSTVSDAIINCWLWSTATRGYFSRLLHVVDNWPHIPW